MLQVHFFYSIPAQLCPKNYYKINFSNKNKNKYFRPNPKLLIRFFSQIYFRNSKF